MRDSNNLDSAHDELEERLAYVDRMSASMPVALCPNCKCVVDETEITDGRCNHCRQ